MTLQFPGLRIITKDVISHSLLYSDWEKQHELLYLKEREIVDKFQEDVGHHSTHLVNLALTGFLTPYIPGLLGFHVFGKGIGGIFRTSVVSSVTAIYAASVTFPNPNVPKEICLIQI